MAEQWLDRARQGRLPHAVLLAGPRGIGKRAAASWMVAGKLGIGEPQRLPQFPAMAIEHADMHYLQPPEDKRSIGIDQVRSLVADLALTSYEGQGKAAIIEPANLMTTEAANSLLKTLEEPQGDALLILVADRVGRIPATIFSRCQRIEIRVPDEQEGLQWLDRLHPGNQWLEPLRIAGGCPLAAIDAAENVETDSAMASAFSAIAEGRVSPLETAATWSKIEPGFVLDWLSRQIQMAIKASDSEQTRPQGLAIGDSVLQRVDRRNLFCYLDRINRLRGRPGGSWNVQLTFEELLIDWATGLESQVTE